VLPSTGDIVSLIPRSVTLGDRWQTHVQIVLSHWNYVLRCDDSFYSYVESLVVKRNRSKYYFGGSDQKETADTTVDFYFIINEC
jgi:hypothetical protein